MKRAITLILFTVLFLIAILATAKTFDTGLLIYGTDGALKFQINNSNAIFGNSAYSIPLTDGTNGQVLKSNGAGAATWQNESGGGGGGDVVGPASATDNALPRYNGTTGKLLQNGTITEDDNGIITMPNQPSFTATKTSAQIIGAGPTKVAFNVEVTDLSGDYDPTTNYRFTAPVAGMYDIAAGLQGEFAPDFGYEQVNLFVYKNGSVLRRLGLFQPISTDIEPREIFLGSSTHEYLAVNDYIEIYVSNTGGASSFTISTTASDNHFTAAKVN